MSVLDDARRSNALPEFPGILAGALLALFVKQTIPMWQHYLNALFGLGVLGAAFLNLSGLTLVWTFGLLGAAIVLVGLWGAVSNPETAQSVRHA